MSRFAPQFAPRTTAAARCRPRTVCVVDPQTDDYRGWESVAEANGVRLLFTADAREALRVAHTEPIDLWVVNAELPGLSGGELCNMLKARKGQTAIYMVANQYTPDLEKAARLAGATMFGCKPAHESWFGDWIDSRA